MFPFPEASNWICLQELNKNPTNCSHMHSSTSDQGGETCRRKDVLFHLDELLLTHLSRLFMFPQSLVLWTLSTVCKCFTACPNVRDVCVSVSRERACIATNFHMLVIEATGDYSLPSIHRAVLYSIDKTTLVHQQTTHACRIYQTHLRKDTWSLIFQLNFAYFNIAAAHHCVSVIWSDLYHITTLIQVSNEQTTAAPELKNEMT